MPLFNQIFYVIYNLEFGAAAAADASIYDILSTAFNGCNIILDDVNRDLTRLILLSLPSLKAADETINYISTTR